MVMGVPGGREGERKSERERERVRLTSFPWSLPIDVVFPLLLSSNSSYLF